jgi:DNA-binding GntR family transcriptional regulator
MTSLRESTEHGDDAWEESVAIALHRLGHVPRFALEDSPSSNPEWDKGHRVIHAALLAGSPSLRLRQCCDQSDRYRSLAAEIDRCATIARTASEHHEIAEATLGRKADLAVKLLREHLLRTLNRVLAALDKGDGADNRSGQPAERSPA